MQKRRHANRGCLLSDTCPPPPPCYSVRTILYKTCLVSVDVVLYQHPVVLPFHWKEVIFAIDILITIYGSICTNHRIRLYLENKEEIWLSPMTKAPTPTEMFKGQSDNTNNATKKFDYFSFNVLDKLGNKRTLRKRRNKTIRIQKFARLTFKL